MVAVYGYVATLIVPVWFLLEGGYEVIRGRVAARRIIALLNLTPDDVGGRPTTAGPRARDGRSRPVPAGRSRSAPVGPRPARPLAG